MTYSKHRHSFGYMSILIINKPSGQAVTNKPSMLNDQNYLIQDYKMAQF